MPQYIALKTFKGKYCPMNRGMTYTLPQPYGAELMRNGLVRELAHDRAPLNTAHEEAPNVAGEDTAGQPGDGLGKPSSVSPPARRSRKQIVSTSNLGPGARPSGKIINPKTGPG